MSHLKNKATDDAIASFWDPALVKRRRMQQTIDIEHSALIGSKRESLFGRYMKGRRFIQKGGGQNLDIGEHRRTFKYFSLSPNIENHNMHLAVVRLGIHQVLQYSYTSQRR